jgi:hypothetical protein
MVIPPNLPEEMVAFLADGRQLNYDPSRCEAGKVTLKSLGELRVKEYPLSPEKSAAGRDDQHFGEDGYYLVRGVNLVARCESYSAEGILLWFPDEQRFGTWDSDHHDIRLFSWARWEDIVADPARHITAQWGYPDAAPTESVVPWRKYRFVGRHKRGRHERGRESN